MCTSRYVEGSSISKHWVEVAQHACSTANPANNTDRESKPELLAGMIAAAHLCYVRGGKSIDRVYSQTFQGKPIDDEHWIDVARHALCCHTSRSFQGADLLDPMRLCGQGDFASEVTEKDSREEMDKKPSALLN